MITSVRKMVARYDIHPRKRLGQSFLEDLNIIRRIVALAEPAEDETIVEIGAGLGFMTEELAKRAGRVIAIEVDPRLVSVLRERFAGQERVEVVQMDVLKYDFSSACPGGRVKVVGNIPYHISSPILFRLLDFRRSISLMILMFQKELADRIAAPPGTKDYGIPSVIVARYTRVVSAMTVPPTCFYPMPDVVSSVLRIEVLREPELPDGALFAKIVRAAFARRRKTLWNNLRGIGLPEEMVDRVFIQSGIDRTRRAETLSVEEFSLLTKTWIETGADKLLDKRKGI
ncbi:MAG: ribosomal RNA small subunit methyltransferase A [Proteobacteria bacterium]|nr:ribosomal RNA small subunit methyltransferase A [Pseudomonadota bacterium]MBU4583258.1 ribosomal RNA small subunit methyltransferase A [Pseudomonadota bacterium]MCG2738834.1 16S rRNA (adenine(1518)-N(6)/adenine(1519)-N(6))-dimethyltransferase RsmA [Syntrophaceae bacterium]